MANTTKYIQFIIGGTREDPVRIAIWNTKVKSWTISFYWWQIVKFTPWRGFPRPQFHTKMVLTRYFTNSLLISYPGLSFLWFWRIFMKDLMVFGKLYGCESVAPFRPTKIVQRVEPCFCWHMAKLWRRNFIVSLQRIWYKNLMPIMCVLICLPHRLIWLGF